MHRRTSPTTQVLSFTHHRPRCLEKMFLPPIQSYSSGSNSTFWNTFSPSAWELIENTQRRSMNEMVPKFQASITQTWIYRIVQLTTEYVHLLLSIYLSHTYILLHTCLYRKMNTPEVSRKTCIFSCHKSRGLSPSRYQPNDRNHEWSFGESQKNRYVSFFSPSTFCNAKLCSLTPNKCVSAGLFLWLLSLASSLVNH